MTDSICFIANYSKTIFFEAIALKLKAQGKKIYWITVSEQLNSSLSKSWGRENILYIHKSQKEQQPISDLKINEIIQSDRVLRTQIPAAKKYLESIQKPIFDFIKNNSIRYVFSEITWGHELLTLRITKKHKELDCSFLNPHTIRIPSAHFGFFEDEQQSILAQKNTTETNSTLDLTPKKPTYLKLNDELIKKHFSFASRLKRAISFISKSNQDKNNPTIIHDKLTNLTLKSKIEINRELYRFIKKFKQAEIHNSNYILLLLHKQPEASIDVIGRYYDDQYTNILNIWRVLPQGYSLLVKEHSNAIGDRSLYFYQKISRLSDTYIIDEKEDTYSLMVNSKGVITVSGTAAYESALMGIDSYTFAPTFFNKLTHCTNIGIETIQNSDIFSSPKAPRENNINEFSDWLKQRAFKGIISDPTSDPNCMSKDNISTISDAFMEIIKHTESRNAE